MEWGQGNTQLSKSAQVAIMEYQRWGQLVDDRNVFPTAWEMERPKVQVLAGLVSEGASFRVHSCCLFSISSHDGRSK